MWGLYLAFEPNEHKIQSQNLKWEARFEQLASMGDNIKKDSMEYFIKNLNNIIQNFK